MSRINLLQTILHDELAPTVLTITDESHLHAGHHTNPGGAETHLSLYIVSQKFAGLTQISRHRLVNDILKDHFSTGLHALKLTTRTENETR